MLELKRKERIDIFTRETIKFNQNSRYDKALTVEELDRMQKAPVELRYFIKLFWGLDNPDFSQENINKIEKRLESLPQRLKASAKNSPNLSEVFLKLRQDPTFVKDMTEVITKQINDSGNSHQIKNIDSSSKQNVKNCLFCLCLDD